MNEGLQYKIYIVKSSGYETLWVAHTPGGGTTTMLKNPNEYWTDKSGDSHFNYDVSIIKKQNMKPHKKTKSGVMFKIPVFTQVYDKVMGRDQRDFSIWGGIDKPMGFRWMTLTYFGKDNKHTIMTLFNKQQEALYWIKQGH